jgi:RNA polymerase sigma-B factor
VDDPAFDAAEDRADLRPALAKLPPRERTILALRFFEGLTQTQIAARVGLSQMQVSRLLARSLERIRADLTD